MKALHTAAAASIVGGVVLLTAAALTRRSRIPGTTVVGAGYIEGKPVAVELARIVGGLSMRKDAAAAYNAMEAAARAAGHHLQPSRAFATLEQQARLYAAYKAGTGNLAAKPGYSNHQGGIAVDVPVGSTASPLYRWLAINAARYGFVRTVPSEPWHWEYRPGSPAPSWQAPGAAPGLSGPTGSPRPVRQASGLMRRPQGPPRQVQRLRVRRRASS